jgi:hypothetical protein
MPSARGDEHEGNLPSSMKESFNKVAYLRLGVGSMCSALFVLSLVHLPHYGWRESVVAFLIGLLSGYYYTSAWYSGRAREVRGGSEVSSPR